MPAPLWSAASFTLLAALASALWTPATSAEPARWAPVPGKSQVAFDARFSLGDFSGRCERLVGAFTLDAADLRHAVGGALTVEVACLATGVSGRDRDLRKSMDAEQFPTMRFGVEGVEASFPSVTDKADVLLTIKGKMLIRDVERPLVLLGRARMRDGAIWVRGEGVLKMSDFGIAPPRRLFLAVADQVVVRFELNLAAEP